MDRHYLIIKILCKLVLYDYFRRNAGRKLPEDYRKEQEWALKELENIGSGRLAPPGLPRPVQPLDFHGNISNPNNYI
jgi:hypothetical protein